MTVVGQALPPISTPEILPYASYSRNTFRPARQRHSRGRSHCLHGILGPKRVGHAQGAFGIVPPLSVHEETVAIRSGTESDRHFPYALALTLQRDGMLLPVCEIPTSITLMTSGALNENSCLTFGAFVFIGILRINFPLPKKADHTSVGESSADFAVGVSTVA